jgi:hypothetical protein
MIRVRGACVGAGMKPDCHRWFSRPAAKRMQEDFGRFLGSGVTNPCRVRYRLIAAAGTLIW